MSMTLPRTCIAAISRAKYGGIRWPSAAPKRGQYDAVPPHLPRVGSAFPSDHYLTAIGSAAIVTMTPTLRQAAAPSMLPLCSPKNPIRQSPEAASSRVSGFGKLLVFGR